MIDQASRCGQLFVSQRWTCACAPLPPPSQANDQSSEGRAQARNPLPLHSWCALMEQGIINHLSREKWQDVRGAVSFLEEVSPQLGWRGARRSQVGRTNCFGCQKHLHSHIGVAPGFSAGLLFLSSGLLCSSFLNSLGMLSSTCLISLKSFPLLILCDTCSPYLSSVKRSDPAFLP